MALAAAKTKRVVVVLSSLSLALVAFQFSGPVNIRTPIITLAYRNRSAKCNAKCFSPRLLERSNLLCMWAAGSFRNLVHSRPLSKYRAMICILVTGLEQCWWCTYVSEESATTRKQNIFALF